MPENDQKADELSRLRTENFRLKRAVEELSILNDLARAISLSHNSEQVMRNIVRRSLQAVEAEQGVINLVDKESHIPSRTLIRTMVSSSEHQPYHANQSLLGWMHNNKAPLVLNDPRNAPQFRGVRWDAAINSLICVPLLVKSALIGILTLYNKKGSEGFTQEDQRLLGIIAAQSAQVIEAARLYEEEQALLHMREELRLAYEIQMNLLPEANPEIPGYDIAGKSIPAQNVGGDYYDFIPMDDGSLAFCLGDITGKGMPAALLMANLQATIRGQIQAGISPGTCLDRANSMLYKSSDSQKFATLFYGILDYKNHRLSYSNAGHNDPLYYGSSPEPERLRIGGIMIGALPGIEFADATFDFHPGDLLVVYSDGITEAEDAREEEFGEPRLLEVLAACRKDAAASIIDRVIAAVQDFAGNTPQSDDITLVVIRRMA